MRPQLTDAIKKDLGREDFASYFMEILVLENAINHTLEHLDKWTKERIVDTPMLIGPGESKILQEPLGTICVMSSWNYPLYTTLGPLIYVIASGNTCLIKPSELAPNTLLAIKNLI